MKIINEIEERRAYRALSSDEIPEDSLARILKAATLAPSCMNKQPWRFLVLNEPAALEAGRKVLAGGNYWALKAPVLIFVLTKMDLDCELSEGRNYAFFDTGMAVMNLQLQAVAEGLRAHPMAGFDPVATREAFRIGDEWTVLASIALGKPGSDGDLSETHRKMESAARDRKPMDEVVSYNSF